MISKFLRSVICLSLLLCSTVINHSNAAPACPYPVKITQPDGTVVTVILKGDERVKWAETLDGYSLLRNNKGIYEYAMLNANKDLAPSGVAASDVRVKSAAEFLSKIQKGLTYSDSQVSMLKSLWTAQESMSLKAFPTTGNRKLVCILMGFKDKAFTKTQADFNNLFNQINYSANGATGSVKDFYLQSSYSQFTLDVTVAGPYTAANNMSYYGANDASGNDANPRALVTEAVNAADASVNFVDFDNDNNGTVDGVYVIYAGYGEEAGASANTIWAHAWAINSVVKDGKTISKYSCSSELRGTSGTTITSIGVICHEFGHVLGAPDYYDTNYTTGGQYLGTGNWDLMASGSWNNNGVTPAQHNAYTKTYVYGWATVTELSTAKDVTVLNANQNKSFYRISSTTANEFWLIENRQQVGFDTNVPGHGMLVYHVHKDIGADSYTINATYPQKMYPVCASATSNPGSTPASYGSINSGGCPYPGTSAKTSFTDATTPSMKSWAGANTGKPITAITETSGVITFKFRGGGTGGDTIAPSVPSNLTSANITSSSVQLSWAASTDNVAVTGYEIYRNGVLSGTSTTSSYSITGLTGNTTYSFTVLAYDAAGNKSGASTALSVTTLPGSITYCTSKGNNVTYEWIDYVQMGGMTNTTTANAGYGDFTAKVADVTAGTSVTISFSAGFKSTAYKEYWRVWIDWNQNGTFESTEQMVSTSSSSSATLSANFTVPSTALAGNTRMRVTMKYSAAPASCETFSYGEVEDYTVAVGRTGAPGIEGVEENMDAPQLTSVEKPSFICRLGQNPVTDNILRITMSDVKMIDYAIFNLAGSKVLSGKLLDQSAEININSLSPGMFIIRMNDGQKDIVEKFIKE